MNRLALLLCPALLALAVMPTVAHAGGLYLTDRGVRQLGRGGAFVAGADDGQSLWYNPAGLAYAGTNQLYVDGTFSFFRGSFQRETRDTLNDPPPEVDAEPSPLPIPTLAFSTDFGLKDWAFGAAVMAPNAVMLAWPERVDNKPGPTRHSLISMEGSAIAHIALGFAYRGIPGLSLGAGGHLVPARFRAGVYLSSCDYGTLCQQPENPEWEAPAVFDLEQAITATGIFGAIYKVGIVSIGASVMLPYTLKGEAKLDVELPNAPLFGPDDCGSVEARKGRSDCAQLNGNEADVKLDMPLVARFGVEVQPFEGLSIEAGVVYEQWSRQDELSVRPKNISITNALSIPEYEVGPISVRRDMQDVFSLRLGAEMRPVATSPLEVRAGVLFENSAFTDETLTPLTLDSQKALLGLGASYEAIDGLWIDVLYAHLFMKDRDVSSSEIYPQNPLRPPPEPAPSGEPLAQPEPVGNGKYAMEADFVGLGMRWNI